MKIKVLTGIFLVCASFVSAQEMSEYIASGDVAFVDGDFAKAKQFYEKAQSLDTDNVDYLTAKQLGLCCQQLNQPDQALNYFKQSVLKGCDDKSLLTKMKQCAESIKCVDCLEKAYEEINGVMPQWNTLMQEKLFYVYSSQNNSTKALKAASEVLAKKPDSFVMLRNVGLLWNGMNKTDSAIYYLDKAYQVKADDETVNKTLGLLYYRFCESEMKAANQRYERIQNKGRSQYNTLLYNRQNLAKKYYPKSILHLTEANKTLNDPELNKLIVRMKGNLSSYQK